MRKFIRKAAAFVCLTVIMLTAASCEQPTKAVDVTVTVNAPPKLVFLGDSIPAGFGLEGFTSDGCEGCGSYPNILAEKYSGILADECGHIMVNDAVSGDTSEQLLKHITDGEFDSDLADSDAVVISIGGNDLLHILLGLLSDLGMSGGKFSLSDVSVTGALGSVLGLGSELDRALEGFDANLRDIVSELRLRTDGEIFVQTLYDPLEYLEKFKPLTKLSAEKIGRLNDIVRENAEIAGTRFYTVAEIAEPFAGRAGELTNIQKIDIHPNADGHRLIADIVDEVICAKPYSYVKQVTVVDEDAVRQRTIIIFAVSAAGIAAAAVIFIILRRKTN